MTADRAARLARVVERMGADVRLRAPTREGRLRRVEDAWIRDRSERSSSAARRELGRRRAGGDTAEEAGALDPAWSSTERRGEALLQAPAPAPA